MAAIFGYIRKGEGRGNAWLNLRAADLLQTHIIYDAYSGLRSICSIEELEMPMMPI